MRPIAFSQIKDALLSPSSASSVQETYTGGIYSNNTLITDLLRPAGMAYRSIAQDFYTGTDTFQQIVGKAFYGGFWIDHFGHFLLETLPLLGSIAAHKERLPIVFHFWNSIPSWEKGYVARCLDALGIDGVRLLFVRDGPVLVKTLLACIPSIKLVGGIPDVRARYAFDLIRSRYGSNKPSPGKLYLTRRRLSSVSRIVPREEEVEAYFTAKGFVVVAPEELDFEDQVNLVSNCSHIAGFDGSALHLSAFSRPPTKMIVLATRGIRSIVSLNQTVGVETRLIQLPADPRDLALSSLLDGAVD